MKLRYVHRKNVSHVELQKDGTTSLGIVVKACGTINGLRPCINSIKRGSVAYKSHCVAEGDVVVSVCGRDAKGMSKKEFKRLLNEARSQVDLKLEYEIKDACFSKGGIYRKDQMMVMLKKDLDSYGFVLRKNDLPHSGYPIVTNIREGGPADRDRRLKSGDRVLQIDELNLKWLSLSEVADILSERDEIKMVIEYTIALVENTQVRKGERTNIEIDCPHADLGIVLSGLGSGMVIKQIQKGSLAERCGAFRVGDDILSINDTDVAVLSTSQANNLLRGFKKKPGNLVLVANTERLSRPRKDKYLLEEDMSIKSVSSFDTEVKDKQSKLPSNYLHTPYSKQTPYGSFESLYNKELEKNASLAEDYDYQMKTISMLHEIIQSAASMHEFLAFLDNKRITDGGFVDESKRNANQESQLLSIENFKLSYLRTISYQTKFLIHSMALHLVKNNNLCPDGTNKDNSQFLNKHRIVQELMKNLVEIYTKKLISKHHLEKLKASICHVDLNCSKCHESCMLTALITQKVLLILSLNDKNQDTLSVINKLIEDLFKINILCDNCRCRLPQARYNASKRADYGISLNPSRSTSQTKFSGSNACSLHQSRLKTPRVDTEYASSRNTISEDLSSVASTASSEKYLYHYHGNQFHNDSQATDRSEFYSLLPTEDMGISERGSITGQSSAYTSIKVPYTSLNPNTKLEVELPIKNSTEQRQDKYSKNKIYKGKEFKILKQTCQSTDALSDVQRDSVKRCAKRLQPKTQKQVNEPYLFGKDLQLPVERISSSKTNDETAYESVHVTSNINSMGSFTPGANNRSFCVQDIAGNLDNIDHLSCTSNCSSHSLMNLVNQLEDTNKLSTVEVKLKNEGTGYGLSIEFLNQSTGMEVPSITSVNPQGAAHKIGVLLKGDRVLAINGRNTFGLTTEEFESLKDEAFGSEEILLVIEFDIAVREIKYGTFDISITKTSKTGLIYKDFKKDSPLVVKGIVKGSPAHRSGELFPGDEILFAKNICQETFDAFKNIIERIETVIVTVRRLPCEDQQDEVTCSSNLSIDNTSEPSPFIRGSKTFNVLRTSIHSDHATDTLFLVQELTLSRDPVLNDFGFLVGQDPSNKMVYITGIRPSGPAECSKVIRINDGILEVNGISLRNSTEGQILSLFQQVGDTLKMKTRRVMRPE